MTICLPASYPNLGGVPSITLEKLQKDRATAVQQGLLAVAKDLEGECIFEILSAAAEVAASAGVVEEVEKEVSERKEAQRWASQCPEGTLLLLSVNTGPKAGFRSLKSSYKLFQIALK